MARCSPFASLLSLLPPHLSSPSSSPPSMLTVSTRLLPQLPPFLASSNDNLQTGGVETWNAASGPMSWEGTHTGP